VRSEIFTALIMNIYGFCINYLVGTNASQKPAASMFRVELKAASENKCKDIRK
jgi:hypothetical protein